MKEPKLAMGFIETVGLVTAIASADAALKSANVTLIGRENSRGDGMITVKIAGNVGAVEAAIMAAKAEGKKVGKVVSAKMIARPASGFGAIMSFNEDTMSVSSWLGSVAPGVTPGKVKRIEGRPSTGKVDLWEAEKILRESEKAKKKAARKKRSVTTKKTVATVKRDTDDTEIDTSLKDAVETVKKKTSRKRKKTRRQSKLEITDVETEKVKIEEEKVDEKVNSSERKLDDSLTEEN